MEAITAPSLPPEHTPHRYVIEVCQDGTILNPVELKGSFRAQIGDDVRIQLPAGADVAQANVRLLIKAGDGQDSEIPFARNLLGGGFVDWIPAVSGSTKLRIACEAYDSHKTVEGPVSTVVVEPLLVLPDGTWVPHEGLSMCTAVAVKLGPLDQWMQRLDVLRRQKFNAIHFTPFQQYGQSTSSYSIADHNAIAGSIAKGVIRDPTDWSKLKEVVDRLRYECGLFSFSDLVLNHTAHNSSWLKDHPEAGYNENNCPWLRGPIELDNAIKAFNADLVKGKFLDSYRASKAIENEGDLGAVIRAFQKECLDKFNVKNWFKLDTSATGFTGKVPAEERKHGANAVTYLYDEALKLVGTKPGGIALPPEVLDRGASDKNTLQERLQEVQQKLGAEGERCYDNILAAVTGTLRYDRLEKKQGAIDVSPWNSMVPRYFSPVTLADGTVVHLANNGWVMGWNVLEDFTGPGCLVYFERTLIAWSDCVKLRYGRRPEDSPFLWEHIARYCERTAEIFDGVRLDNCHSTPLPVGQYMLSRARKARPNLFVFAELFTSSAVADETFERELGLNALVREALQTGSPGDLAWHAFKYGGIRAGALPAKDIPATWDTEGREAMPQKRVLNLFYDCTHDNPTLFQKGRINDALANAAFVTASACAVGSTMGYETCVEQNPEVWDNGELYVPLSPLPPEPPKANAAGDDKENIGTETIGKCETDLSKKTQIRIVWRGDASTVSVWGTFDSWRQGKPMEFNEKSRLWECYIQDSPEKRGTHTIKFVLNGDRWIASDLYPIVRDEHGNVNNQASADLTREALGKLEAAAIAPAKQDIRASPGIIEARRILNQLHWRMAVDGYDEVSAHWPSSDVSVITRHSQKNSKAIHFVIRSYWCKGPDFFEKREIMVDGKATAELLLAGMNVSSCGRARGEIKGAAHDRSCLFTPQPPNMHYNPSSDTTTLTFGNFPSGSIFVLETAVNRGDSLDLGPDLKAAVSELDLDDLNKLLWSCDQEERDRSKGRRGVYQFDGSPFAMEYAGIAGVLPVIEMARMASRDSPDTKQGSPWDNVERGNWLLDYHACRMKELFGHRPGLTTWFMRQIQHITSSPHKLHKQQGVDLLFTSLFAAAVTRVMELMPEVKAVGEPLAERLALATTQVVGHVPSATVTGAAGELSLSAGLPFFSTEYMREWGRDTFLAAPGLLIATGRHEQARREILGYARMMRHGQIPNLLDSSNNPRYNARDAVFFWMQCVKDYCTFVPDGAADMLLETVEFKYPLSLEYDMPWRARTVEETIQTILTAHWHGIRFRERDAGVKIDALMKDEGFDLHYYVDRRTGFPMGGNRFNCGTWMDKMGSSEKAGNKGLPASPRDGAPVELTLALWSILNWIVEELQPQELFTEEQTWEVAGKDSICYREWRDLISANFDKEYFIPEHVGREGVKHTYKDTWGCKNSIEDLYLRCNFPVGLSFAPELPPKDHAEEALEIVYERLVCEPSQVGMKTLDPQNPAFRPNYDNSNYSTDKSVAHGWNYHMGPEWVWPLGNWFQARYLVSDRSAASLFNVSKRLGNIRNWIIKAPWYSLPEIMDSNGRVCVHGCQAQAWSLGTVLWFIHLVQRDGDLRNRSKAEVPRAVEDLETQRVVEDLQNQRVVEDLQNQRVVEDLQAQQPVEDPKTEQATEDLEAQQPIGDPKTEQATEDLEAQQPIGDRKTEQVTEDLEAQQATEDGKTQQVVEDLEVQQTAKDRMVQQTAEYLEVRQKVEYL